MAVENDIAAQLVTAGLGTLGTTIFLGKVKQKLNGVPSACIFVNPYQWGTPQDYCDGNHANQMYYPAVQVMVRSAPSDEVGGLTTARAVIVALHDKPPTGYISCRAQQSEPLHVGETDDGEYLLSVNFYLRITK